MLTYMYAFPCVYGEHCTCVNCLNKIKLATNIIRSRHRCQLGATKTNEADVDSDSGVLFGGAEV